MPFFSTVIPVFNRADLIGATIESVLDQSLKDHQVIVVDDGSTDGTAEVLARYADRITIIRQTNAGPGAARNAGIAAATGSYITFIDSDDLWFPWTLATFHRVIKKFNSPAFIATREFNFHHESDLRVAREEELDAMRYDDYFTASATHHWLPTCGVAIRADALKQAGGFTAERINYEETDLWLRLGTAEGFVWINQPRVAARRRHAGMITLDAAKTAAGVMNMIATERSGGYPGGAARRSRRVNVITRHARSASAELARRGEARLACRIYRATWRWHVASCRLKYLLGLPAMAAWCALPGGRQP